MFLSLQRQVLETITIKLLTEGGTNITNSKVEYNRCLLPTLQVVGTYNGEKKQEESEETKKAMNKEEEDEIFNQKRKGSGRE